MQEPNPEIPNLEQLQKTIYHTVQKLQRKLDKQQKELDESAKHLWFKQLADSILASPRLFQKESKSLFIILIPKKNRYLLILNWMSRKCSIIV